MIRADPEEAGVCLLQSKALLVLEGLDLQWVKAKSGVVSACFMVVSNGPAARLHAVNCRFLMNRRDGPHNMHCVGPWNSALCHLQNCQMVVGGQGTSYPALYGSGGPDSTLIIENCLIGQQVLLAITHGKPMKAVLNHNTILESFMTFRHHYQVDLGGEKLRSGPFEIVTSANIFSGPLMFVQLEEYLKNEVAFRGKDGEQALKQLVSWRDHENLYSSPDGYDLLKLWLEKKSNDRSNLPLTAPITTLAAWKVFWGIEKLDSARGQPKYQGGNLVHKAKFTPDLLTAEDFRLRPDSAGYRASKDGKDLGADIDLVGPGPAYERWKKTPAYQRWLKDSGQLKK